MGGGWRGVGGGEGVILSSAARFLDTTTEITLRNKSARESRSIQSSFMLEDKVPDNMIQSCCP